MQYSRVFVGAFVEGKFAPESSEANWRLTNALSDLPNGMKEYNEIMSVGTGVYIVEMVAAGDSNF